MSGSGSDAVVYSQSLHPRLERERLPYVDVLRGFSILAVVLLHIDIRIPFAKSSIGAVLPREVGRLLFRSGYHGVRVFFVVSGFLITTTILRRWRPAASISVRQFYALRAARIAPCLIGLLSVMCAFHLAGIPGFVITRTSLGRALLAALTFRINALEIAVGYLPATWDVLWSLSIEEVFYGAYPLLLRFVRRRAFIVSAAVLLIAAGPLARSVWSHGDLDLSWDYAYLAGFDCIALGCLAAMCADSWRLSRVLERCLQISGVSLMLLVLVFRETVRWLQLARFGLDVTVLALGTALFLWGSMRAPAPRQSVLAWSAPIRWLGKRSYEVYLTHSFVTVWGMQLFVAFGSPTSTAPAWHVGMLGMSALLGWVVADYFSEPLNRRLRGTFGTDLAAPRRSALAPAYVGSSE